jgi:hypothetical protein
MSDSRFSRRERIRTGFYVLGAATLGVYVVGWFFLRAVLSRHRNPKVFDPALPD